MEVLRRRQEDHGERKPTVERNIYRSFWDKYSGQADINSMMLNANADELDALDRADILASLPDFAGKTVVDIGAGIGRFTTVFAETAKRVVSSDFIASFIDKNRERNGAFENVDFRVSDALGLEFEEASVDLTFTNWLLMYLGDEDVIKFVTNALKWLRPDGHLHIRESCSEPSTKKPSANGTTPAASSLHQSGVTNPVQ